MKKLIGILILMISHTAMCQEITPIQKDIKQLMEITGSAELGNQFLDQFLPQFYAAFPDVPQDVWDEFRNELNIDDLVNQIIPLYEKYFSHEEIKLLIEFYQTPLGKKSISVMPSLMQESMMIGQKWGIEAAEKAKEKLEDKGYIKN